MKEMPLMDRRHFDLQLKRLSDSFGFKVYGDERANLFWREMNQPSNEWMTRTVELFIKYQSKPPLMEEFDREIVKEREKIWNLQKKDSWVLPESVGQYLCSDCMNSGRVQLDLNGKLLQFGIGATYLCHCDYGARRPENFPRLSKRNLKAVIG
jgi:hypothetical protein